MASARREEEESSPLIPRPQDPIPADDPKAEAAKATTPPPPAPTSKVPPPPPPPPGWSAEGLPAVVGEPVGRRSQWDSGLFSCLGRNDEFCSSDLEVCLLGSITPCVLYGTNVERMRSGPGTFANHCLGYTGLYFLGNSGFGYNALAPWLAFPNRTAMRHRFNLEGNFETLAKSCRCCGGILENEEQRERCETMCDFTTHFFCHTCALCQEGRELRRRLPHPGFNGRAVMVMLPPMEQTMARGT